MNREEFHLFAEPMICLIPNLRLPAASKPVISSCDHMGARVFFKLSAVAGVVDPGRIENVHLQAGITDAGYSGDYETVDF
jgi:hypothetical protein